MCAMHCDHGFKVDEDGCDICECNDARELYNVISVYEMMHVSYKIEYLFDINRIM